MQRQLNNRTIQLIPVTDFRAQYHLPESFGVNHFEPKDYTGLARLDAAGDALHQLKTRLLSRIPDTLSLPDLLSLVDSLQQHFETELRAINDRVGLREPEIDFAVAGFGDVLRMWTYRVIAWQTGNTDTPDFAAIYQTWLNDSTRLSQQQHEYEHQGDVWQVQILNDVYGRIGLRIDMLQQTVYVQDNNLACPAAGFMFRLLQDCTGHITDRLSHNSL
jgi:hypothetical protein